MTDPYCPRPQLIWGERVKTGRTHVRIAHITKALLEELARGSRLAQTADDVIYELAWRAIDERDREKHEAVNRDSRKSLLPDREL